jgi:hypothetical protein
MKHDAERNLRLIVNLRSWKGKMEIGTWTGENMALEGEVVQSYTGGAGLHRRPRPRPSNEAASGDGDAHGRVAPPG